MEAKLARIKQQPTLVQTSSCNVKNLWRFRLTRLHQQISQNPGIRNAFIHAHLWHRRCQELTLRVPLRVPPPLRGGSVLKLVGAVLANL